MDKRVPYLMTGLGPDPAAGGCVMQVISFLQTRGWTDSPPCVLPTLQTAAIEANDSVGDDRRQDMVALIPRLMNTRIENDPDRNIKLDLMLKDRRRSVAARAERDEGLGYQADDEVEQLIELLDFYDELTGRPKDPSPPDYTALVELQADLLSKV